MACGDKIKNTCDGSTYAGCIDYENELGVNTKLTDDCVTLDDTTKDLYDITDDISDAIDVSEVTSTCITIPEGATAADIITLYEAKICELDTKVETLESTDYSQIDITAFGLTYPVCVADACDNPPVTLGEWMQVIMDQRNCT